MYWKVAELAFENIINHCPASIYPHKNGAFHEKNSVELHIAYEISKQSKLTIGWLSINESLDTIKQGDKINKFEGFSKRDKFYIAEVLRRKIDLIFNAFSRTIWFCLYNNIGFLLFQMLQHLHKVYEWYKLNTGSWYKSVFLLKYFEPYQGIFYTCHAWLPDDWCFNYIYEIMIAKPQWQEILDVNVIVMNINKQTKNEQTNKNRTPYLLWMRPHSLK